VGIEVIYHQGGFFSGDRDWLDVTDQEEVSDLLDDGSSTKFRNVSNVCVTLITRQHKH
jgi:hypothetical protein